MIDGPNLKGIRQMRDDITRLKSLLQRSIEIALEDEASSILQNANSNYVPIASGDLRDSGEVLPVEWSDGAATVAIRYSTPYAVAVHENPSQHDPPTWQGVQVQWKDGKGPKYLEIPLREAEKGFVERVGKRLFP